MYLTHYNISSNSAVCCSKYGKCLKKIKCSRGGSNSRPSDYETDALPTELLKQCFI